MKKLLFFFFFITTSALALESMKEYGLSNAVAVTPSDTVVFNPPLRHLEFNATVGQTIKVDLAESGTVSFSFGGTAHLSWDISVRKVYATGTTTTGIVGLW